MQNNNSKIVLLTQPMDAMQQQAAIAVGELPLNNYKLSVRNVRGDIIYSAQFMKN